VTTPNLLIVVVDSLRADAVNRPRVPTPTLDEMSRTGVRFLQCVATASSTTPSFASMFTGCYPPRHGVRALRGYRLSASIPTMGEVFQAAGYHTAAFVTGPLVPPTGILRGFSEANHRRRVNGPFMDWSVEVLDRLKSLPSPWLAVVHVWEVHRPYRSEFSSKTLYGKKGYEAAVTAVDGRLPRFLDAAGDESIVVVTGDHGETYASTWMGDRGAALARELRRRLPVGKYLPRVEEKLGELAVGHGFTLSEDLVRVPLVIARGGGGGGVVLDRQVRHIDLLPTLAELCGVPAPIGIDGESLAPAIRGDGAPEPLAYMETGGVRGERLLMAARSSRHKLIKSAGELRLYEVDGKEKQVAAGEHAAVVSELHGYIEAVNEAAPVGDSGMTQEEEASVEEHLRDLGYL
jgi:arylsulfatase A-like enzyme